MVPDLKNLQQALSATGFLGIAEVHFCSSPGALMTQIGNLSEQAVVGLPVTRGPYSTGLELRLSSWGWKQRRRWAHPCLNLCESACWNAHVSLDKVSESVCMGIQRFTLSIGTGAVKIAINTQSRPGHSIQHKAGAAVTSWSLTRSHPYSELLCTCR